jgi:hypothetical protein
VRVLFDASHRPELVRLYEEAELSAWEEIDYDAFRHAFWPPINVAVLRDSREAYRRMRDELIQKALALCQPHCAFESIPPKSLEDVGHFLPTEKQIQIVLDTSQLGRSRCFNQEEQRLASDWGTLCKKLPIPFDDPSGGLL